MQVTRNGQKVMSPNAERWDFHSMLELLDKITAARFREGAIAMTGQDMGARKECFKHS